MKRFLYLSFIFTLVMLLTGLLASPTYAGSLYETVPGNSHIVLFKNAAPRDFQTRVEALGGTVDLTHPVGIAIVSGLSEEAAGELGKLRGVQSVQESGYFAFDPGMLASDPVVIGTLPESPEYPTLAAFYAWQWNMRAIDADEAWAAGYLGSPEVTVAILDTGIDYTYPDLDGLVDLSRSISFVPEDDFYVDYFFPEKHHVTDIHYHGTHVAATVASKGIVAAGVTSQTTLMGVKVCSAVLGYCPGEAIVQGILHAIDNGADVINMSLGGYFYKNEYPGEVAFINKLFTYANRKGVVVVVSAGNAAMDLDHNGNMFNTYCDAPNVVCVSATGPTSSENLYFGPWYEIDAPAFYTNYGRSAISVAAPGGNSGGYVWAACSQTSLLIDCSDGVYVLGMAGTSMAAPHVSGLAALVVEDVGRKPAQVRNAIAKGADDLGQPGTDPFYGKGRINVHNTID